MSEIKKKESDRSPFGASDVTRTRDLLITSEMHYRLCYTSEILPAYYSHKVKKSQQIFICGMQRGESEEFWIVWSCRRRDRWSGNAARMVSLSF